MDQAESLREYMHRHQVQQEKKHNSRMITIASGKGGVGKSNFTLNFALALKSIGKKVVILDLDLSTANIDILMGASSSGNSLADVLHKRKYLFDCIEKGTGGIDYITGGLELQDLLLLDHENQVFFMNQIQELNSYADFILLDTGAGISKILVDFIIASDETILVTTPEPTSIADSYSVMKTVLQYTSQAPKFRLVVNRARSYREAIDTSRALKNACSVFLKMGLNTLGFLMEDAHVQKAVRSQSPFYLSYPNCEASKNMKQIMYTFLPDMEVNSPVPIKGVRGFFEKMLSLRK
ncbi:MinD/ParA family protein [Neobacillus sp. OS1-32]|uniref:MinD/ParA family protein n=1 Tax=Neobacillus paridis TaxID=2803862 RepID=A0ABS1TNY6_9BACI|nr:MULTISPECIES: MinD/ParA family protein [Neobacillus]MBL4952962.1 MinD/ParA family protein [Neobacillus paridis]WML31517.1 MinD/ParA family protein [Neobacillus sp. OS1-32]